jgi:hypothetical protein
MAAGVTGSGSPNEVGTPSDLRKRFEAASGIEPL